MPLRYYIMKRRLLYWWHLCHSKEDELIKKVYSVQCLATHRSDWVYQLKQDCNELDIQLTDNEVTCISKSKFKNYIKNKIENHASTFLNRLKDSHSKSQCLPKYIGKPDAFLFSNNIKKEEKLNLFKLKTRMVNLACNFPNSEKSKRCYKKQVERHC